MPPGYIPLEVFWAHPTERGPRGRPRTRWRDYTVHPIWAEKASGSPSRSWKMLLGRGMSGVHLLDKMNFLGGLNMWPFFTLACIIPCVACCHPDKIPDKWKIAEGWKDGWLGCMRCQIIIDERRGVGGGGVLSWISASNKTKQVSASKCQSSAFFMGDSGILKFCQHVFKTNCQQ